MDLNHTSIQSSGFVTGRGIYVGAFCLSMAIVTDLTTQKRDSDRVNVFLDGQFSFGLAAKVAAELRVGQQLSEEDIEHLKSRELFEKAKQNALGLVSLRPRSEHEVRAHLQRKSFEDVAVDHAVAYLQKFDLLDDVAFANYWVEQRETFRPRSRFALSHELRQKGISRDVIEGALEQVDESAAARRAAEKQAHRWAGLPEHEYKKKMAGFLQRRGFSYEVIREVLEDSWQAVEES